MKRLSNYLIEKLVLNDKTKIRIHKHRYTKKDFEELKDFEEFFNSDFDDELVIIHLGDVIDNENKSLCCWGCIEYFDEDFSEITYDPDCFLIFNDEQFDFFIEEHNLKMKKQINKYEAPQWLYDKIYDIGIGVDVIRNCAHRSIKPLGLGVPVRPTIRLILGRSFSSDRNRLVL